MLKNNFFFIENSHSITKKFYKLPSFVKICHLLIEYQGVNQFCKSRVMYQKFCILIWSSSLPFCWPNVDPRDLFCAGWRWSGAAGRLGSVPEGGAEIQVDQVHGQWWEQTPRQVVPRGLTISVLVSCVSLPFILHAIAALIYCYCHYHFNLKKSCYLLPFSPLFYVHYSFLIFNFSARNDNYCSIVQIQGRASCHIIYFIVKFCSDSCHSCFERFFNNFCIENICNIVKGCVKRY